MKKIKYIAVILTIILICGVIFLSTTRFLLDRLYSDDVKTQRWAVDSLIERGEGVAPSVLALAEDTDEDLEIRRLAIYVLGEVHSEKTVSNLIKLLETAPEELRPQAVYALRKIKDPLALEALIRAYRTGSKFVKVKALMAMGEMDEEKIIPILKEAGKSNDKLIREIAETALEAKNDSW